MIIIDVRTPEEFVTGHVGSAVNLPLDQIAAGIFPDVDLGEKIVLYCRSGGRAENAKQILEFNGYTHVTNAGGLHDVSTN